jgi:uncharacterized repeat protein (TIGR01451 family)
MNWGRLAVLAGTAALLVAIAVSLGAGSAPAGNRNPISELLVSPGPAGVTNGQQVALTARLVNHEKSTYTNVFLTFPIPAGATFVSTTCASFSLTGGAFVCTWGKLSSGQTASVVIVLQTPSSGAAMPGAGSWAINEGKPTNTNETFATNPVSVPLFATNDALNAAGFMTTVCSNPSLPTLSTPALGPGNPLSTSVCAPNLPTLPITGIAASIAERNRTGSDPGITQVSDICLPQPTSDCGTSSLPFVFSPFATFTFAIDNTTLGSGGPGPKCGGFKAITKVFHDGALVPAASTDPDIVSITCNSSTKKTTVVISSSENGKWEFG